MVTVLAVIIILHNISKNERFSLRYNDTKKLFTNVNNTKPQTSQQTYQQNEIH